MADPRGPTKGWSPIVPTQQGWYFLATEAQIESGLPILTRVWCDGSGGTYAPAEISEGQRLALKIKPKQIISSQRMGRLSKHRVFLPVYGSLNGSYFKACGPLLDPSLPAEPEPGHLPKFQDPATYMTPSQRAEAKRIERNRPR